jgi:hypothetical protein
MLISSPNNPGRDGAIRGIAHPVLGLLVYRNSNSSKPSIDRPTAAAKLRCP